MSLILMLRYGYWNIQWFDIIKLLRAFTSVWEIQEPRWALLGLFFFFKEIILLHFLLNALFWVRHQQTFLVVLITGFEILAFPCNQFGGQEPGSNPEIKQFACTRFKAEFPIFDKVLLRSLCYSFRLCVLQIRISLNPTGRCEWTEHSTNLSVLEIKRRRILGWSH